MPMTDEDWRRQHQPERPKCGSCKATGLEHEWNNEGDLVVVEPRRPCRTCGGTTYFGPRYDGKPDMTTERDLEILGDLQAATDNYLRLGDDGWVQPIDCGGSNGSDHSYRLTKLVRLGLAEQRRRGGWSRGSKSYRITEIGRAALTRSE